MASVKGMGAEGSICCADAVLVRGNKIHRTVARKCGELFARVYIVQRACIIVLNVAEPHFVRLRFLFG